LTAEHEQRTDTGGTPFLTAFDYGQGGLWAFVIADSADAIRQEYPELEVIPVPPPWMDAERLASIRVCRLADHDDPFLAAVRTDRARSEP